MQIAGAETIHWCSSPAKYGSFIVAYTSLHSTSGCSGDQWIAISEPYYSNLSNGESPKQAGITLSFEDFNINIGNGDQTTPGSAQKWLFLFSFLQKLPVEKGSCFFSVLTPSSKQGHRQISYIRIAEYLKYSIFRGRTPDLTNRGMVWAQLSEKYIERRHVHLLLRV